MIRLLNQTVLDRNSSGLYAKHFHQLILFIIMEETYETFYGRKLFIIQ